MAPTTTITLSMSRGNLENILGALNNRARWKSSEDDALLDDRGGLFDLQMGEEVIDDSLCYTISWTAMGDLVLDGVQILGEDGRELIGQERIDALRPRRQKFHTKVWFDQQRGNLIRKIVMHNEDVAGSAYTEVKDVQTLTNKLTQEPSSGIWYPSSWVYLETRDGSERKHEVGSMEYLSVNKPFHRDTFSLEKIEALRPGTPVTWHLDTPPPGKGKLEWDGKKVFAHGKFGENWALYGVDPNQARKRWIIIVCVNVAIIALFFSIRYYCVYLRNR